MFMGDNEVGLSSGSESIRTTKATLEMSNASFRRAKATAASRGQTLKQFMTGARLPERSIDR
jgi:hypothetical protein